MTSIQYAPIGIICSPLTDVKNMPFQSPGAENIEGAAIELKSKYQEGLREKALMPHELVAGSIRKHLRGNHPDAIFPGIDSFLLRPDIIENHPDLLPVLFFDECHHRLHFFAGTTVDRSEFATGDSRFSGGLLSCL